MQGTRDYDRVEKRFYRLGHAGLQRNGSDRQFEAGHFGDDRTHAGNCLQYASTTYRPGTGFDSDRTPVFDHNISNFRMRMYFNAERGRCTCIRPGDRIMPRYRARSMIQRSGNRVADVIAEIQFRAEFCYFVRIYQFRIDAQMFVDLGAPARCSQSSVRMRQRQMAPLGIEDIEI